MCFLIRIYLWGVGRFFVTFLMCLGLFEGAFTYSIVGGVRSGWYSTFIFGGVGLGYVFCRFASVGVYVSRVDVLGGVVGS